MTGILDLMHALSYAWKAAKALDEPAAYQRYATWIWQGEVVKVIDELKQRLSTSNASAEESTLQDSAAENPVQRAPSLITRITNTGCTRTSCSGQRARAACVLTDERQLAAWRDAAHAGVMHSKPSNRLKHLPQTIRLNHKPGNAPPSCMQKLTCTRFQCAGILLLDRQLIHW